MRAPRPVIEPRGITWEEVARAFFRKSPTWLRSHIDELDGFPRPDPLFGVFAREAVENWWRKRFGLSEPANGNMIDDIERELIERAEAMGESKRGRRRGKHQDPLPDRTPLA